MAFEPVKEYFSKVGLADRIQVFERATQGVGEAATWLDVPLGAVAKSIVFDTDQGLVMVVCSSDDKIDPKRFKAHFGQEPVLLADDQVAERVGHIVGGVCPFDLPASIRVYLDMSLRRFPYVYPAAGSRESAIGLSPNELAIHAKATSWAYLCHGNEEVGRTH
ncbi:YbaK/EbsC family protein [Vaginisenegalia massiliensis]|uniref:YbaK/EbsC family protein n=1 Tax=Vaginisenegalia massiliensis TaxID=2058294 RepID=UPI000F526B10|nr:YbaK/EbsC family protein [Vaginisenegalia massiliensis]